MKTLLVVSLALTLAGSAFAAQLILQPDPTAGKDSMIYQNSPSSNWGTYQYLMVNFGTGRTVRGLVEFTGLSGIPGGATVTSATLELWARYNNSPNDDFGVYRITASWSESSVNWTNQPAHYATAYDSKHVTGGGWYSWDLTTLVQEWVSGTYTNYGFKLIRANEGGGSWPYFVSSDYATASNRPKLTVNYTMTAVASSSIGRVKALYR